MKANLWNNVGVYGPLPYSSLSYVEFYSCTIPPWKIEVQGRLFLIYTHLFLTQRSSQMVQFPPTYTAIQTHPKNKHLLCIM